MSATAESPEWAQDFEAQILESMSAGIVAIDDRGRMALVNAAARRILGLRAPRAELLGQHCREALAGHPAVVRLLLETVEREGPLSRSELVLGGDAGTLGFTLCPVRDAAGRPCGAAIIFRDLAFIERRDEQERLRERLAALGEMAAGLAHEIRNPLAGMEVLAGLLRRRLADRPEECALLAELTGELRSVADTVAASLDFVRPVAPVRGSVDAGQLLEDSLAVAQRRVAFEGEVERRFDPEVRTLRADPEQLRTLFSNLVVNALEAMAGQEEPAPRLCLGLGWRAGDPPEVEITVSDTGPGIPAELSEKIFYPFFTTKRSGSGVGLAAAQKIVASHGGSLALEAGAVCGSTFRVRLPSHDAEAA